MSGIDDVEYANLAEQVRRIELLVDTDTRSDSSFLLTSFIHNAKSRMEEIRYDEVRTEDEKKDQKVKETASVVQLAEMEHRLNAEEKQQYSEFLKLDYFRRKDLDELAAFYKDGGGYDKLSEEGKLQMSERIEEGIRRGEFVRDDLPERVNRKNDEIRGAYEESRQELAPVKSYSNEYDYLKETKPGEKEKGSGGEKVKEEATTQNLAFTDSPAPLNPTDIQISGTGRSI